MKEVISFYIAFALFACFTAEKGDAQISSCWASITPPNDTLPPYHQYANPDSVMVDTCSGSATYQHRYAAKWFRVEFQKVIFSIPAATNLDTSIDRGWRDIPTIDTAIRDGFDSIELHYGTFVLQKAYPGADDTTNIFFSQSQVFLLKFDNYVDIDSAQSMLKTIPSIYTYYQNRAVAFNAVRTHLQIKPLFLSSSMTTGFLNIQYPSVTRNRLRVFDMKGCDQSDYVRFVQASSDIIGADCSLLADGFYFLAIDNNAERFLLIK
ncbi:MAG: hypothetical protein ABI778_06245 [Ignavibacteriota bacterium]